MNISNAFIVGIDLTISEKFIIYREQYFATLINRFIMKKRIGLIMYFKIFLKIIR